MEQQKPEEAFGPLQTLDGALRNPGGGDSREVLEGFYARRPSPEAAEELRVPSLPGEPRSPRLPPGVRRAEVHIVRAAKDIDRLIPSEPNSEGLIAALKLGAARMAPYYIYTYYDALGGSFTGIDLSARPDLVDSMPELQSHEGLVIKKILARTNDVQVLVREEGKTPDLVVNGVVTEIKSLINEGPIYDGRGKLEVVIDLPFLINKADSQVREHASRHGLGHGAAAVDLTRRRAEPTLRVPEEEVLAALNEWGRKAKFNALDRVFVFAGDDLKAFALRPDGSYLLKEAPDPLFSKEERERPIDRQGLERASLLARQGRLREAEHALNLAAGKSADIEALRVRETINIEKLVGRIRRLAARGRSIDAFALWSGSAGAGALGTLSALESRVREILPLLPSGAPRKAPRPAPPDSARFVRELKEPMKILRKRGIEAAVTIFGSAQSLPYEEAHAAYRALQAGLGPKRKSEEGRRALEKARRDVRNSLTYEDARRLARHIAQAGGGKIAVFTGGGPGTMAGANRGAREGGAESLGFNIRLPREQAVNPYVTASYEFNYFSTRKTALRMAGAFVYFFGGFGTLDELFEALTLIQTDKERRVPIILVDRFRRWNGLKGFLDNLEREGMISAEDLGLIRVVRRPEDAFWLIQRSLYETAAAAKSPSADPQR